MSGDRLVCRTVLLERRIHMKSLLVRCKQFLRSEDAPTATEYAVMLALIIVVAIAAISTMGEKVSGVMTKAGGELDAAQP
jgi:pilus assembly protein Flp/PilA